MSLLLHNPKEAFPLVHEVRFNLYVENDKFKRAGSILTFDPKGKSVSRRASIGLTV